MNESDLEGAIATLLNHYDLLPPEAFPAERLHELWNEWPSMPASFELTTAALAQLEDEGMVERIEEGNIMKWRRLRE